MKKISKKSLFIYLQKIFLYYWITSILGHYLEIIWGYILHITTGAGLWVPNVSTTMPLAPPYGMGMIAIIVLVIPLIKKYKLNPLSVFILNVIVTGATEYFCALGLVMTLGHNNYWNYTNQPFNISGYVCLESAVLFSVAATAFVYFIYPVIEKFFKTIKTWQFNAIFWLIFIAYLADLITVYVRGRILG